MILSSGACSCHFSTWFLTAASLALGTSGRSGVLS